SATQAQIHTSHTCGAGRHVCSISVQGDVNPCSFLGPGFNTGNIRETPFPIIWRTGQQMRRLRPDSEDGTRLQGRCRARSLPLAGWVDAADPWCEEAGRSTGSACALHPGANVEVAKRSFALPLLSSP